MKPEIDTLSGSPFERFQERLRLIFEPAEGDHGWAASNKFVFDQVRCEEDVAIAGSVGAALRTGKAEKQPGDIDFVARSIGAATGFLNRLEAKLFELDYGFWRRFTNSRTKFVPDRAIAHIRLECGIWLPICVFVLEDGGFKSWFTPEAYPVQFHEHIQAAAEDLEARDGKHREAAHLDNEDEFEDGEPASRRPPMEGEPHGST